MIKITLYNGEESKYSSFKFSGGEVSVKLEDPWEFALNEAVHLFAPINNSNDLMELLLVTDAIRQSNPTIEISVTIPYLPYARQDRVMVEGEAMSLKVFANIINAQNYVKVYVWDAHSSVGVALIDRCVDTPQYALLVRKGFEFDPAKTILVSPDAGAEKKIYSFAKAQRFNEIMFASKVRDVSNGKIKETKIQNPYNTDKDFLIVDDICDGGGTFIALAEVLHQYTTGKIKLLVTHGIFSKGIRVFDGIIDEVYVINRINVEGSTERTKVFG